MSPVFCRDLLNSSEGFFPHPQEETGNSTPDAAWPEDGGQWSDGEGGEMEESGLLQEVAEEDEEIDLYNEETFGLGWVAHTGVSLRLGIVLLGLGCSK